MPPTNDESTVEPHMREITLPHSTVQLLRGRSHEKDETYDDVITRLLDETRSVITLEEAVNAVVDHFDHVACLVGNHLPTHDEPSYLEITVYTGDVDTYETTVNLHAPNVDIVVFPREDKPLILPFSIVATCGGPEMWNSSTRTTIYMAENVVGADPVPLETGRDYLNEKLARPEDWEVGRGETMFDDAHQAITSGFPDED